MSERLTTRLANGGVGYDNGEYFMVCYPWNENCLSDIDRMAIKLCELEDKIEQGDVVEVRHGEWIEKDDGWDGVLYTCSVCNCDWTTIDGTPFENNMRYCPECGAKMDGERSENGK